MAWYSSWTRAQRLAITVPAATVAPVSYFPVVLTAASLPTELTNNSYGRSDGGDLAFAADLGVGNSLSSIGAQIPCEVVAAVFGGSPSAEIHVQVPSVAATGTLTYIWCLYGNPGQMAQPAASSTYGAQKVWLENGVQNYQAVLHLADCGTGTIHDSTVNGNSLTNHGITNGVGVLGSGGYVTGSAYAAATSSINLPIAPTAQWKMSFWVNFSAPPATNVCFIDMVSDSENGNGGRRGILSNLGAYFWGNNADYRLGGTYAAGVYKTDMQSSGGSSTPTITAYQNGTLVGSGVPSNALATTSMPALSIAIHHFASFSNTTFSEVRVESTVRSASWIAAEYANQFAPSTFILPSGSPLPITSTTLTAAMLLLGF